MGNSVACLKCDHCDMQIESEKDRCSKEDFAC